VNFSNLGYGKRSNVRSKAGSGSHYSNYDSNSKASSFKMMNKSIQKNKTKEKLNLSGSTKTGRQTNSYISSKKRLKISKGKVSKQKEMARNITIQNQRVNAVKSLIKFKPKIDKSDDTGGVKEDPTINNEFTSPYGEACNIKNLIKLHLPADKKDMMMYKQSKKLQRNYNKLQVMYNSSKESTNDLTYHKTRANSNETRKGGMPLAQASKGKNHSKVNSLNRKPMKLKTSQKAGNKTNRN
jgi:hypothetical protein